MVWSLTALERMAGGLAGGGMINTEAWPQHQTGPSLLSPLSLHHQHSPGRPHSLLQLWMTTPFILWSGFKYFVCILDTLTTHIDIITNKVLGVWSPMTWVVNMIHSCYYSVWLTVFFIKKLRCLAQVPIVYKFCTWTLKNYCFIWKILFDAIFGIEDNSFG